MRESSISSFGLVIAYLVPGLTALWGASYASATLRNWLATAPADAPTVGGFLYITIGSLAAGLVVSTVRWALIDFLHHETGIPQPAWDFSRLQENVAAFDLLVEIHYRYYQFYANMLVALTFAHAVRRFQIGFWSAPIGPLDLGFVILAVIFLAGSRDTLRKYYERGGRLLGRPTATSSKADRAGESPVAPDQRC